MTADEQRCATLTWEALGWPDLSPDFPTPTPASPPPPRPAVPDDIAERVRRAEVRRGIVVPLCMLSGLLLVCAAAVTFARLPHTAGHPPLAAIVLLLLGLLIAFPLPALATLLLIGPTWEQRLQHLRLLRWQADVQAWRSRERARYLASLAPDQRQCFRHALQVRQPS